MKASISNSFLSLSVLSKGAELCSLQLLATAKEYIWEGDPAFWGKHSPVLFPIVGTLKNNQYYYNGLEYHLLRHGFARDNEFELIINEESRLVYALKSNEATKKLYPFEFELQIGYTINEQVLSISYTVINKGAVDMPFSIGAHPAFALNKPFNHYSLAFEEQETLNCYPLKEDLIDNNPFTIELKDRKLDLEYRLFEKDALIFKELQSKEVTIMENDKAMLKVSFDDFKSLGLWTKIGAGFICIEPWLGYSDGTEASGNLEEKEGILFVKAKSSYKCQFTIELIN
ncbi:aldose 1-epimerase family protein [Flavobacterium sp. SUN046]|uniref:aldose 1-epimerase family protein n=1 Tax=Flavobacterium sp. SUN046 TaxID=3002440 RepID=UPI002DBE5DD2|nr:aldose 1-epimerase family protein [Flavobacterium sp. SUN046]MEC4050957.1 aldose 1-epimerase family protein [Flavobacterium sp. SUN046]